MSLVRVRLLQPVTILRGTWPAGSVIAVGRMVAEEMVRDGRAEILSRPWGLDTTVAAALVPQRSR